MILLAAEVKELRANPNRKARGLVIEGHNNSLRTMIFICPFAYPIFLNVAN